MDFVEKLKLISLLSLCIITQARHVYKQEGEILNETPVEEKEALRTPQKYIIEPVQTLTKVSDNSVEPPYDAVDFDYENKQNRIESKTEDATNQLLDLKNSNEKKDKVEKITKVKTELNEEKLIPFESKENHLGQQTNSEDLKTALIETTTDVNDNRYNETLPADTLATKLDSEEQTKAKSETDVKSESQENLIKLEINMDSENLIQNVELLRSLVINNSGDEEIISMQPKPNLKEGQDKTTSDKLIAMETDNPKHNEHETKISENKKQINFAETGKTEEGNSKDTEKRILSSEEKLKLVDKPKLTTENEAKFAKETTDSKYLATASENKSKITDCEKLILAKEEKSKEKIEENPMAEKTEIETAFTGTTQTKEETQHNNKATNEAIVTDLKDSENTSTISDNQQSSTMNATNKPLINPIEILDSTSLPTSKPSSTQPAIPSWFPNLPERPPTPLLPTMFINPFNITTTNNTTQTTFGFGVLAVPWDWRPNYANLFGPNRIIETPPPLNDVGNTSSPALPPSPPSPPPPLPFPLPPPPPPPQPSSTHSTQSRDLTFWNALFNRGNNKITWAKRTEADTPIYLKPFKFESGNIGNLKSSNNNGTKQLISPPNATVLHLFVPLRYPLKGQFRKAVTRPGEKEIVGRAKKSSTIKNESAKVTITAAENEDGVKDLRKTEQDDKASLLFELVLPKPVVNLVKALMDTFIPQQQIA